MALFFFPEMSKPIGLLGIFYLAKFFFISLAFIAVPILFMLFLSLATIVVIIKPKNIQIKEIFREIWRNYWHYIVITVLVSIFISLGFVLFIIPGFILSIYLRFSFYASVDEKRKGIDALKRSWNLVKGNWWKVFGKLVLLSVIVYFISFPVYLIENLLCKNLNWCVKLYFPPTYINNPISIAIVSILTAPFVAIFGYLVYLDLKKSKEMQIAIPVDSEIESKQINNSA